MRTRSYEYYEIRANVAKETEEVIFRGSYEDVVEKFEAYKKGVREGVNLYLMRVQLLTAYKQDKEETREHQT